MGIKTDMLFIWRSGGGLSMPRRARAKSASHNLVKMPGKHDKTVTYVINFIPDDIPSRVMGAMRLSKMRCIMPMD
jgi:hypothetical protein